MDHAAKKNVAGFPPGSVKGKRIALRRKNLPRHESRKRSVGCDVDAEDEKLTCREVKVQTPRRFPKRKIRPSLDKYGQNFDFSTKQKLQVGAKI